MEAMGHLEDLITREEFHTYLRYTLGEKERKGDGKGKEWLDDVLDVLESGLLERYEEGVVAPEGPIEHTWTQAGADLGTKRHHCRQHPTRVPRQRFYSCLG